uniref:Lysis protein n=1 Tax=viral metagenome TaxID=1070528 RepID=A0A6M3KMW8_9ZZZZ
MIFTKLKAYGFQALSAVLGALLLAQTYRLHSEQLAHRDLIVSTARAAEARTGAVLADEQATAGKESTHANQTMEASDVFTQGQPARDDALRADLSRAERLRVDAERRAATYRAQAQADDAARVGLADRLETLDRHIVEGVEVVGELRAVVDKRDAEVVLLRTVIDADRHLLNETPHAQTR